VREQAAVLLLDLVLDEAEGHAFLKSRPEPDDPEGVSMSSLFEGQTRGLDRIG
jgi:hypothetical protein